VGSSMEWSNKMQSSIDGLTRICQKLSQGDEVGLLKFGDKVEVVSQIRPYTNAIYTDIDSLTADGWTALYDAIAKGIQTLRERSKISLECTHQNILLISTDGEENHSKTSFADVMAMLKNPGIPNFRIMLAIAGDEGENANPDLVTLLKSAECQPFCEIINVADSSEGIKQAYVQMDQKVQLLKAEHSVASQNKSINLEMKFGATEVSVEAFVASTKEKKSVTIKFHGKKV